MRLTTIWTLPDMAMAERMRRSWDWLALEIAAKMPARIRYWAVMVAVGKVTSTGPFASRHPMGVTVEEIISSMERGGPGN